jgi:hypothetical protein
MPVFTYPAWMVKAGAAVLSVTVDGPAQQDPPIKPPPDSVLIRFNLVCTVPVHIKLWRTSQIPWREFTLPPGSYEYPAGGPVQKMSDITYVYMTTV